MTATVLGEVAVAGAFVLMASSGFGKALRFARFRAAVDSYGLLPARLVPVTALAVVGAELGVAAGLVQPVSRTSALVGLLVLCAVFATAQARGRRNQAVVDCGCYDLLGTRSSVGVVSAARLVLVAMLALGGLVTAPSTVGVAGWTTGALLAGVTSFGLAMPGLLAPRDASG